METNYLSIAPNLTASQNTTVISFTNPDGTKVDIGMNDYKNIRVETKDGVLWVSEIK